MNSKKRPLTAWMIAMINVAAICNIKNFPLLAEYGLATVFFLGLALICFFIPLSLVSAELATGWPDRGVYTWVKEGIGPQFGFLAIWLQWIENVIWYPTILSFIAATFAFAFMPDLASNRTYILCTILGAFWISTLVSFCGMRVSGWISSISALFGSILPIVLILLCGAFWLYHGLPSQIDLNLKSLIPHQTSMSELAFLAGFLFSLTGIEMSAVHAKDVAHPETDYPKAILLSAILIVSLSALGSIAVSILVPNSQLELASSAMDAFKTVLSTFHISWALPAIAAVMALGAFGMMNTWMVGPSRGLLATAQHGDFPPIFQKVNKHSMPVSILVLQAIIVSVLSLVFLYMPSVNASYWILIAMSAELYMIMYILLFISAVRLRYKRPNVKRAYRVPGGNIGMWIASVLGILGSIFAIVISVLPPKQLLTGNVFIYESILIGGTVFFCLVPLIIYHLRKPHWKNLQAQ